MNNDMKIINKFLKSKNKNLECINELSGGTNNRIYSVNDKYFVKFKGFFFIMNENIRLVNLGKTLTFAEIYFKIILGDENDL